MITRVWIGNYNGIRRLEMRGKGCCSNGLVAQSGSVGKSSLVNAIIHLREIARGAVVTQQVFTPGIWTPGVASSGSENTLFGIEMLLLGKTFNYEIQVSFNSLTGDFEIRSEELLLDRRSILTRNSFVMDRTTFALPSSVAALNPDIVMFRNALARVCVLRPNMDGIVDLISGYRDDLRPDISNLPRWLANYFSDFPSAYQNVASRMALFLPNFGGLNVCDDARRARYLCLRRTISGPEQLISQLSRTEKMMLLVSTVCMIREVEPDRVIVWDDFLLGIQRTLRDQMLYLLMCDKAFCGQLLALSSVVSDVDVYAVNERFELVGS